MDARNIRRQRSFFNLALSFLVPIGIIVIGHELARLLNYSFVANAVVIPITAAGVIYVMYRGRKYVQAEVDQYDRDD